ncbi:biosynthetic arginine decarboxylase [Persicirhabdus sediminis]|uniref:Arginine decarboxylase n=1 Tax=Persicirhabdus sediminis TaxID=454144 RepID=A0A8J7MD01_9BACT|nr:biosynthetic arginine decarboxylase [Persicirhabdus sediminis]MBK1790902.1 biosynthetic arginine decarboxylase [Persicirhabdus sediminis]
MTPPLSKNSASNSHEANHHDKAAWSSQSSSELYGVEKWANEFFSISDEGDMQVHLQDGDSEQAVSLPEIVQGARDRGLEMPLLLRFPDLLTARIKKINEAFHEAIHDCDYRGHYRGVYPIKVNQQQQVIEEVTEFGRHYHYGLEAGSKPELLTALAYMHDPKAYIICNGYKDKEFIDLALRGQMLGLQIVLVIEMPGELDLILQRAALMNLRPLLGVRVKLCTCNDSHWSHSSGENSVFGLTPNQVLDVVDKLRSSEMLDCLQLMHYHQGSQVPDIRAIREAAVEATRIYCELSKEGAAMGLLDIGGGLGIDYDGTRSKSSSSRNYGIREYAADIVDVIKTVCDEANEPHPNIISESGRAIAAYYSVLIFNILDINQSNSHLREIETIEPNSHNYLSKLESVIHDLNDDNAQECYNDAVYYRSELLSLFHHGNVSLRERAQSDRLFHRILAQLREKIDQLDDLPDDLIELTQKKRDVYYGNFSLFQSLPDTWAIDQLFPVMPIHRLDEQPTNEAIIADITCDCDGRIDKFLINGEQQNALPVHYPKDGQDYMLGVFLVGAYQETLGDLHNLMGDTNVVSIGSQNGRIKYQRELSGDSVADVLSYVEYDPKHVFERFLRLAERSVEDGKISAQERKKIIDEYRESIAGYTYFES